MPFGERGRVDALGCGDAEQHPVGVAAAGAGVEVGYDWLDGAADCGVCSRCLPEGSGHGVGDGVCAGLEVCDGPGLHDVAIHQLGWAAEGVDDRVVGGRCGRELSGVRCWCALLFPSRCRA